MSRHALRRRPGVLGDVRAGAALHVALLLRRPLDLITFATTPLLTVVFTSIVRNAGQEQALAAAAVGSGLIGLWVLMLGEVAETVSADRSWGTLPMLLAAPASLPGILTGRLLAAAGIAALTFAEAMAVGAGVRGAPLHVASAGTFALAAVLTVAAVIGTGALLAPLFLVSRLGLLFEIVLAYPFYILGAVLIPVDQLPGWARPGSDLVFLRWSSELFRAGLTPGAADVTGHALVLSGLTVASYGGGVLLLHRTVTRLRRLGSAEQV